MKKFLRILEIATVGAALLVLTVRVADNAKFSEYTSAGGQKGFWSWFAGERLGLSPASDATPGGGASAAAGTSRPDSATVTNAFAKREAELERKAASIRRRLKRMEAEDAQRAKAAREAARRAAEKHRKASAKRKHGDTIKVGGKSSYVAADGRTPYRVNGIRGIEFGSSDNAPGPGVKPILRAYRNDDGSLDFRSINWQEEKKLSDSIYGFDRARLNHTFDSEQLSTVTLHKEFPKTEEGMRQALEFYKSMSNEASADLGFDVVDVDRTGRENSARLFEFTNRDGDTAIHGALSSWNDKSVTVELSVSDKTMRAEQSTQSKSAYERGVADAVDARVWIVNQDLTDVKAHSLELLPDGP